jgi:hypothetical protein
MDRAVLGLYHVMRELSFLRGPAGHALCAPLLLSVTNTKHIDAFMYDCMGQMRLQLNSILRDGSSMLASRESKARFATLAEFDTLCAPFGLDGRKSVRRRDVPCTAPFSAVLPHICLTIDQAVQKCREHGALVPGAHSMEMHSRSLVAISEGYSMVCDRFEKFMLQASGEMEVDGMEAGGTSVVGNTPGLQGRELGINSGGARDKAAAAAAAPAAAAGNKHQDASTDIRLDESSLVSLCQISVDASYLGIACRSVGDRLVRRSLKIQDRAALEHVQSIERRLVGIAMDAQVRMHEDMCARIDNIMRDYSKSGALDWMTCSVRIRASAGLDRITEQVQSWFYLINMLQSSDTNLAYFVAFRHISKLMMKEMEMAGNGGWGSVSSSKDPARVDRVVKFITVPAISNFSTDLAKLEVFAEKSGVHDLKQTLAEPRQLCDLLLSGNIDAIIDQQVRQTYYPSVPVEIVVQILRRHKHVTPRAAPMMATAAASVASARRRNNELSGGSSRPSVWARMFGGSTPAEQDHDDAPLTGGERNAEDSLDGEHESGRGAAGGGVPGEQSARMRSLPPKMTRREAEALATRIERKIVLVH